MSTLFAAVMFLTRVRVPASARRHALGDATSWFPIVGAALGLVGVAIVGAIELLTAVPPAFTALLLVSLAAWATGALHLDGLADAADGFGGGRTRESVLAIMRDPRVGSFGVVALILVIGMKTAALAILIERHREAAFLVAAPAVARWTVVPLAWCLPYARAEGGLGSALARRNSGAAVLATLVAATIAILAAGAASLVILGVAALVTLAVGAQAHRRIGGVTGDVFGACVELTETSVLATGVFLT